MREDEFAELTAAYQYSAGLRRYVWTLRRSATRKRQSLP